MKESKESKKSAENIDMAEYYYKTSVKVEVMLEAYADIIGTTMDLLEKKHISRDEKDNIWVRLLNVFIRENQNLLHIKTQEEIGKAEGRYFLARELLDREWELMEKKE